MQQELTLDLEADEGVDKFAGASGDFPFGELAALLEDTFVLR